MSYQEHRVRTSLDRHLGESTADPETIDRLARQVYRLRRGVFFTEQQLQAMPWQSRELILAEARRFNGDR